MKESAIAPEVAELQSLLMDLQSAIKFSRLYPLDHPLLKKALQKAMTSLTDYLAIHQKLRLRIRLAEIYSGSFLIDKNHGTLQQWAQNLYTLGIQELIFYEGASEAEILKFITTTGLSADVLAERGGIESVWEQDDFTAIRINVTLKAEIQKILSAFSVHELQTHQDLQSQAVSLLDFLGGESEQLGGGGNELLEDLLNRPEHLSEVLLTSAQTRGTFGQAASVSELSQQLMKPLNRMVGVLQESSAELKTMQFQRFARVVNCFDGELKTSIAAQLASNSKPGANQATAIPLSFFQELGGGIAKQAEEKPEGGENGLQLRVNNHAIQEPPDMPKPETIELEETIVERAANAGWGPILSSEDILNMEKRDFLKEDQIAEMTSFTPLELKIIEDSLQSLRDSRADEPFWHATAKMIWLLQDPSSLNALRNSLRERMISMLEQSEFNAFALGLHKIGEMASQPRLPEGVKGQLLQIGDEMKGQTIRHRLLAAIRGADKSDPKAAGIVEYLSQLSIEATEDLLQWLEVEEQRWLRRIICQLLAQMGSGTIETLWQHLSSERWYVVRNVLSVLGLINEPRSIPQIIPFTKHPHPLVRKEALKALGLSGSPSAFAAIAAACEDKDEQVKIAAVDGLGVLKDPRAKPLLFAILRHREFFMEQVDLKKAAIQALYVLGDLDAIPLLDRLTRRSWFAFSNRHQEISLEARKALEQLKRKRLHDYRTQSQLPGTED
jgi:HEAT repeat protein